MHRRKLPLVLLATTIAALLAALFSAGIEPPTRAAQTLIYGLNAQQDLGLTQLGADGVTGPAVIAVGNYRRLFKFHPTDPKYHPNSSKPTAPPEEAYFTAWANDIARALLPYKGQQPLAEIWNEPNLAYEWGDQPPDPAYYVKMLKALYPIVKAAVPDAVIVTAGLSTVGTDQFSPSAMDDATFLRGIYDNGGRGFFDAVGTHPYGFGYPPEEAGQILSFRRAETQQNIMAQKGDSTTPLVATEFGWIRDPSENGRADCLTDPTWNGRQWQKVSAQTQANYTVRAYQYAYNNWPWMLGMFLFNLDYSTGSNGCDQVGYYAIKNQPAEAAFAALAKPGQSYLPTVTPSPTVTPTSTSTATPSPTPSPTATPTPVRIQISGSAGGSLTTSDGTTLQFPPNVAASYLEVRYQPRPSVTAQPDGLVASQRFFLVQAFDAATLQQYSSLSRSYTMTLPVASSQLGVVIPSSLQLYRQGSGIWTQSGITQTLTPSGQVLAQTSALDTFGIFGRTNRVFLPVSTRNRAGW